MSVSIELPRPLPCVPANDGMALLFQFPPLMAGPTTEGKRGGIHASEQLLKLPNCALLG
jgi:hypothetical protein